MNPVHVVLGFPCKTDNCDEFHAIAHLGEKDKVAGYKIDLTGMGNGVTIPCPRCGQSHFYEPRKAKTLEINSAPPPGTPPSVL